MHLCVVFSLFAEHVNHLSCRAFGVGAPFRDLHHRFVAVLSPFEIRGGNEDVCGEGAAFGDEEGISLSHLQFSDEGVGGSFDDFDDFCFSGVSGASGEHGHFHSVSVECVERVAFADKDALSAVVGQEGVSAVALSDEGAFHDVGAHGVVIFSLSVGCDVVFEHQFVETVNHNHFGGMVLCVEEGEQFFDVVVFSGMFFKQLNQAFQHVLLFQSAAFAFLFFLAHGLDGTLPCLG